MRGKKLYIWVTILVVVLGAGFIAIRSYIFNRMAYDIEKRIDSLELNGFSIRYDTIRLDWRANTIEIDNLILEKEATDTTCNQPESISVGQVQIEGIGLAQLIFRKVISLESVSFRNTRAFLRKGSFEAEDSVSKKNSKYTLKVDDLSIHAASIIYADCDTIAIAKGYIGVTGLSIDFDKENPPIYAASAIALDSAEVDVPSVYYTFRAKQAKWNIEKKAFRADSLQVIPTLGKKEFARTHGIEIDRFDGVIPYLAASGIAISTTDSLRVGISLAEIEFHLKVYRDKRYRFVPKEKLLPVAQLRQLPFNLTIDSLKVMRSFVQYEEFAEGTEEPGGIYFGDLNAVLDGISSVANTGHATLKARAKLFGQGNLSLVATFPFEQERSSSIKGSIRNFNLPRLNAILTPSTNLGISSGQMKRLAFDFAYNDIQSDGQLELNYENLKLVTYKDAEKTDGDGLEKDNFKSFIINTFVFRKNMTEDLPEEQRTGTIHYKRDQTRSIFNLWSKSLISGIKSAYNLDKVEAKRSEKEERKEMRKQRRKRG